MKLPYSGLYKAFINKEPSGRYVVYVTSWTGADRIFRKSYSSLNRVIAALQRRFAEIPSPAYYGYLDVYVYLEYKGAGWLPMAD